MRHTVDKSTYLILLILGSCAQLSQNYKPQEIVVYDQKIYDTDKLLCSDFAQHKFVPHFDLGSVLAGAGKGAGDNATAALVGGPAVIAVGAAGGATSQASLGLDAFGQSRYNVNKNCLLEITHRDGSALIANPN